MGGGRAGPQAGGILHGAAVHLGTGRLHRRGGRLRPGEAGNLVPGLDELADDGGTDKPARPGNKYVHDVTPVKR